MSNFPCLDHKVKAFRYGYTCWDIWSSPSCKNMPTHWEKIFYSCIVIKPLWDSVILFMWKKQQLLSVDKTDKGVRCFCLLCYCACLGCVRWQHTSICISTGSLHWNFWAAIVSHSLWLFIFYPCLNMSCCYHFPHTVLLLNFCILLYSMYFVVNEWGQCCSKISSVLIQHPQCSGHLRLLYMEICFITYISHYSTEQTRESDGIRGLQIADQ